jgi:peptidyl-tRNA hydrolase, PTH1 family
MEQPYLIVGLGNPGGDYRNTRHNAGFMVTERLGQRWRLEWRNEKRFAARVAKAEFRGKRVSVCQPQTFMNLSGEAVRAVVDYYRIEFDRFLVIVDDADLPLGTLRLRPSGSSGGHHGLESIEKHLGTREYSRLRVGIGRKSGAREISGYVLGRFSSTEADLLDRVLNLASDQTECWLDAGVQTAMNQFNGAIESSESEG